MKIGIIGTGVMGSTLVEKLSQAGNQVKVTNTQDFAELSKIAESLGAKAATLEDVVKDVEAIILSIPFSGYKDLPKSLFQDVPEEVVIMDTSNNSPLRDGELEGLAGKTESEYISELLGRPVVKVFNMLLGYTLKHNGKAAGEKGRIAVSVAGDNDEHKKIAAELVDQMGFDTVDGGSLALSWRQEPGTPAFCTELNAEELELALPKAEKGKGPARRDFIIDQLIKADPPASHEETVALMRSGSSGNLI
ncbi:3-hydroxyisobutyrate dehydrogenase [Pedobacter sp. Leaf216]|uniref:NADPH-dependent F420 reductase n=4 Tax=unclassified Pedobacter TaxID=2628915 RepID=UPI000700C5A6|nr:NAD(P)-binding domain-containing protein [Pedobacter sp. Leaf216]KQM73069.1 3-hydroxyisobutyrate dehydrogenase [Pedobacter sp. Leaf216]